MYWFNNKQYIPQPLTNMVSRLYCFYQGRTMTCTKYYEIFMNLWEIIEHYGGSVGIHPIIYQSEVEKLAGGTVFDKPFIANAIKEKAERNAQEIFMAVVFLLGIDQNRYGDMVDDIRNNYMLGLKMYPKTVLEVYHLLLTWHPKFGSATRNNIDASSFAQEGEETSRVACWGCGMKGVVLSECKNSKCMKKWAAKQCRREEAAASQKDKEKSKRIRPANSSLILAIVSPLRRILLIASHLPSLTTE